METNSEAVVTSPVDLNKLVENPALVAAIAAVSQVRKEVAQKELFYQLNHANFLVAFNNNELDVMPKSVEGQAKIMGLIKVLTCSDSSGRNLLPVFTDWAEIEAFASQKLATLVMPSSQLWPFVLDGSFEGIVINPAGSSTSLGLEQIRELQQPFTPSNVDVSIGRSRRVRSYHRLLSVLLILVACYFYRASAMGPCTVFGVLAVVSIVLEFVPLRRKRSKPAA